jgi:hypothetical protein
MDLTNALANLCLIHGNSKPVTEEHVKARLYATKYLISKGARVNLKGS